MHKTTSECLRLEAIAGGGGGGGGSASSPGGSSGSSSSATGSDNLHQTTIGSMSEKMHHPYLSSAAGVGIAGTSSVSMLSSAAQAAAAAAKRDKPKTSFQITSVITKGNPTRISADNGDDSADDLDEFHAEDSSHIDTETPSFSEDTFSKEDVFFTASDGIGIAPVIPTSSQYGLAIVAPNLGGGQNLADVHVSVTDAGINLMTNSKKDDLKDMHHRNERFKVVKIESTEPFRRGRWICMDYLDHSTLQPTVEDGEVMTGSEAERPIVDAEAGGGASEKVDETEDVGGQDEGAVGGASEVSAEPESANDEHQPVANENQPSSSSNNSSVSSNNPSNRNQASQAQTMAHIPVHQTQAVATAAPTAQGQSHPAQYYSQVKGASAVNAGGAGEFVSHGATLPTNLLHGIASQNTQNSSNTSSPSTVAPLGLLPAASQQLSVNVDASSSPQQESSAYSSPSSCQLATTVSPLEAAGPPLTSTTSNEKGTVAAAAASFLPNGPVAAAAPSYLSDNAVMPPATQPPVAAAAAGGTALPSTTTVQPMSTTSNETCEPPSATAGPVSAMEPLHVNPNLNQSTATSVGAESLIVGDSANVAAAVSPSPAIVGGISVNTGIANEMTTSTATVSPASSNQTQSTAAAAATAVPNSNVNNGGGGNVGASSSTAPSVSGSSGGGSANLMSPLLGQSLPQQQQQLLQNIVAEDGQSNEDSER